MSKSNDTCLGCLVFFIVAAIMTFLLENIVGVIITIIVVISLFIIIRKMCWYNLPEEERNRRLKRKKDISYINDTVMKFLETEYGMPIDLNKTVRYDITREGETVEYWVYNNRIYFFPYDCFEGQFYMDVKENYDNSPGFSELADENIEMVVEIFKKSVIKIITIIDENNIEYFKLTGEILSNVTGGGSDLGGAIIGSVLAGGVGAIIGSREEISTEFIDNKRTIILYRQEDNIRYLEFDKDVYDVLISLFPKKNYDYIALNPNENKSKNHKEDIISDEELKELEVINKIKNRYNINNPETSKSILDKCENVFKTDIGINFINELKKNCNQL